MPMPHPALPETDVEIDAVVLLRANARGVATEASLLVPDAPRLSVQQLRESLARLDAEGSVSCDRGMVRCPDGLSRRLRTVMTDEWRQALTLAWFYGNAWRGPGMPLFGLPPTAPPERVLRTWTYDWARRVGVAWWPPAEDAAGPAPAAPMAG